ncbi:hypothetical protein BC628DRAFT_185545 [Trametes gibbosa]|nr:hypothetical protein BC628DRAFT_185545 [Trametes gibbosa]
MCHDGESSSSSASLSPPPPRMAPPTIKLISAPDPSMYRSVKRSQRSAPSLHSAQTLPTVDEDSVYVTPRPAACSPAACLPTARLRVPSAQAVVRRLGAATPTSLPPDGASLVIAPRRSPTTCTVGRRSQTTAHGSRCWCRRRGAGAQASGNRMSCPHLHLPVVGFSPNQPLPHICYTSLLHVHLLPLLALRALSYRWFADAR